MPSAPREPSLDTGITEEPKSEAQCKKRRPRAPVTLAQVKRKLVTKEDRFHLHKTFGTLALISFGYRYFYVWPTTGHLGLDVDALGIGTMAVHTLLSLTSLPFRVPLRRIRKQPTMIWQEYRLHAVIFTLRCAIDQLKIGLDADCRAVHPQQPRTAPPPYAFPSAPSRDWVGDRAQRRLPHPAPGS